LACLEDLDREIIYFIGKINVGSLDINPEGISYIADARDSRPSQEILLQGISQLEYTQSAITFELKLITPISAALKTFRDMA